jgi:hypothetical protein
MLFNKKILKFLTFTQKIWLKKLNFIIIIFFFAKDIVSLFFQKKKKEIY